MKIKMLETVEDSHPYVLENEGKLTQKYDVRKFYKGGTYDHSKEYPDWPRRAKGFVERLKVAVEIK